MGISAELSMKEVLMFGIFIFIITKWKFMLSWVEHEKKFYNLGANEGQWVGGLFCE